MHKRPDLNDYFMNVAEIVKTRSTCLRRQVGAVLVKDKQIISTGYNGAPANVEHCINKGCIRQAMNIPSGERHELCISVHSEQNAILQAAKHGQSTNNCILYVTHSPCILCAKAIINAGIKEVYYKEEYNDVTSKYMLINAGVKLEKL